MVVLFYVCIAAFSFRVFMVSYVNLHLVYIMLIVTFMVGSQLGKMRFAI